MKKNGKAGCEGQPPKEFLRAVDEFNTGRYYKCHDTLEDIWREEPGKIRELYQGLLQVSVALYHEGNGNRRGAVRLMESGMALLDPFRPQCLALALSAFLNECAQVLEFFENNEAERLPGELHPTLKWVPNLPQT